MNEDESHRTSKFGRIRIIQDQNVKITGDQKQQISKLEKIEITDDLNGGRSKLGKIKITDFKIKEDRNEGRSK